ncbi:MAG: hypothetical protein JNM96_01815 [Bacteroidia bacterium]|nr:hypothetical protein [Bacteroidia bacterium]
MNLIVKYKVEILGIVFGAVGGLLYYNFVGCKSGSCAITSNPFLIIPYGALLGYFTSGLFKKQKS